MLGYEPIATPNTLDCSKMKESPAALNII